MRLLKQPAQAIVLTKTIVTSNKKILNIPVAQTHCKQRSSPSKTVTITIAQAGIAEAILTTVLRTKQQTERPLPQVKKLTAKMSVTTCAIFTLKVSTPLSIR